MPIGEIIGTVAGSSYNPLKDIWLYIKHRRRHVMDLDVNFKILSLSHKSLLSSKECIKEELKFKTKNNKYRELKGRIEDITQRYEKIESKYKKSGIEHLLSDENVASGEEGSTSSTQVTENQHIGQRKIWTNFFFSNARLDKDVLKLTREIDAPKIDDVKLETLVNEEILVQRKTAPKRDSMPLWPYVEKIFKYLENASTKRIGIHGEPQVGKSTVLKMLNNCFNPKSSSSSISLKYDVVIWVDFPSKNSGDVMGNMQHQILKIIRGHDEQSSGHNATKINEALAKVKYLLILDDVYEGINLANLGIHDDHKFGQIVIGATGKGVLNLMNVDKSILIEKLEYDASEKFFKECLGLNSHDDLSLVQPYMKKIIELTGGHIGALVGIANFMKGLGTNNTYFNVWKVVVHDLQLPNSPQKLELGALEKAYKLPYNGLKDKNLKKCLLYVALFPVGYHAHTSYLVECWKAQDFSQDYNTFKEAHDKGYTICHHLTETHLLEWSGEEHLKMPLLFRKVALQIPYPDDKGVNKILVRNISERCKHPSEQDWDIAKRISLMCGKLDSDFLPNHPMCNNTSTLLLQTNLKLRVIGNIFFVNMINL